MLSKLLPILETGAITIGPRVHPIFSMTGKKPDVSEMWILGSECYTYEYDRKKLYPKGVKGVFGCYDKNSPAHLVNHPEAGKVMKHRLVKFITIYSAKQGTQTEIANEDLGLCRKVENVIASNNLQKQDDEASPQSEQFIDNLAGDEDVQSEENEVVTEDDNGFKMNLRAALREREKHHNILEMIIQPTLINIDYCYKVCGAPQTYIDAINSPMP